MEFFWGRHMDAMREKDTVKLAVLDAQGNVIHVSGPLDLFTTSLLSGLPYSACYDVWTGKLTVDESLSFWALSFYVLISLCGLIFTVLAERLMALLFRLSDSQKGSVVWVNIVSQLLMRIGFVLVYPGRIGSYALAVALFEILAYSGEFLVYGLLWKNVSVKKRLAFVCAANTVSLLLGLWVNRLL